MVGETLQEILTTLPSLVDGKQGLSCRSALAPLASWAPSTATFHRASLINIRPENHKISWQLHWNSLCRKLGSFEDINVLCVNLAIGIKYTLHYLWGFAIATFDYQMIIKNVFFFFNNGGILNSNPFISHYIYIPLNHLCNPMKVSRSSSPPCNLLIVPMISQCTLIKEL